jgi:hypothetical protein
MQLNEGQSRKLMRTHGIYAKEACDRCGRILGPVRWTLRDQQGAWCSPKCRDGVDRSPGVCRGCGTPLNGKRKDAMYCNRTCRMRTVRREVLDCANIVNTPIQKKGVADAISAFGYGGINPELGHANELSNERELLT